MESFLFLFGVVVVFQEVILTWLGVYKKEMVIIKFSMKMVLQKEISFKNNKFFIS